MSITLISNDAQSFQITDEMASKLLTVQRMVDDEIDMDSGIPLNCINARVLTKVLEYLAWDLVNPRPDAQEEATVPKTTELTDWETNFLNVEQETLFYFITAANYLEYGRLLDAACQTVANMIKGKTPEQIRQTFNLPNDFTPEEQEQIRKENEWLEEK